MTANAKIQALEQEIRALREFATRTILPNTLTIAASIKYVPIARYRPATTQELDDATKYHLRLVHSVMYEGSL